MSGVVDIYDLINLFRCKSSKYRSATVLHIDYIVKDIKFCEKRPKLGHVTEVFSFSRCAGGGRS